MEQELAENEDAQVEDKIEEPVQEPIQDEVPVE